MSVKVLRNKQTILQKSPKSPRAGQKGKGMSDVHSSTPVIDGYSSSFRSHAETKKSKAVCWLIVKRSPDHCRLAGKGDGWAGRGLLTDFWWTIWLLSKWNPLQSNMVCQEDPARKDSEVLLGVRWYVVISLGEKTTVEVELTKDAMGHSHRLLFCSLRCEFGRGVGGMTRSPDYTCSALYFCGFWLVTESAGGSVSSSVELGNTTWPTYFTGIL